MVYVIIYVRRRLQISTGCYTPASTAHGGGVAPPLLRSCTSPVTQVGTAGFSAEGGTWQQRYVGIMRMVAVCVHPACGLALTLEQLVPVMAQQAAASNVR
jgi:hypothetical protein